MSRRGGWEQGGGVSRDASGRMPLYSSVSRVMLVCMCSTHKKSAKNLKYPTAFQINNILAPKGRKK